MPINEMDTHQNRGAWAGTGQSGLPGRAIPAGAGDNWLAVAQEVYRSSTSARDEDLIREWENAWRAFNNEHPHGSKYGTADYRHRSKLYRPKTRTALRRREAAAAAAFFASEDVATVSALDDGDDVNRASAEFWNEVLSYRLTTKHPKHGINWFLVCMGAVQTSSVMGVCASKQHWRRTEREVGRERVLVQAEDGQYREESRPIMKPVIDKPVIDLLPPENLRIDRAADWIDPVNSSPYLIIEIPMFVTDVKARMKDTNPSTGQPEWKTVDDAVLAKARVEQQDSTRRAREGENRRDSKDQRNTIEDHHIVWVRENFIRTDGRDMCFYTVGGEAMLTDPKPTEEVYPEQGGQRPVTLGCSLIEAHKVYPIGIPALTRGVQQEANEHANLRIDAARLAMSGRPIVRAGRNVNLRNLSRHIPGQPIMVREDGDVKWDRPPDVGASAYAEQDRLNVDFDELAGNFSTSSVQTSRQLNETVGGMNILAADANQMADYDLRVFVETWVEATLMQVIRLEQYYETDPTIMTLAGQKARLVMRYGIDTVTDDMLEREMVVSVNVGIGATDPGRKLQRLTTALAAAQKFVFPMMSPEAAMSLPKPEDLIQELFGHAGYKDAGRFFNFGDEGEGPVIRHLMEMVKEARAALEDQQAEREHQIALKRIDADAEIEEQRLENEGDIALEMLRQALQPAMPEMPAYE